MKLISKVRAIVLMAAIAVISMICAACGSAGPGPFEFKDNIPDEALYKSEIYFRDYIPREYGVDYELYASYSYEDDTGATINVTKELQPTLAFQFDHVTDYHFTLVRNGDDSTALKHSIRAMPEAPVLISTGGGNVNLGREYHANRLAFYAFGAEELLNADMASIDPAYKVELKKIDFISAEVNGRDILDLSFDRDGMFRFDTVGFYELTFEASNSAGTDTKVVTMSTVNVDYHSPERTGYLLEAGVDGNETDQLVFDAPKGMQNPGDGNTIKIRFGSTADEQLFDAKYSAYYDNYTVENFTAELDPDMYKVGQRIYIQEPVVEVGGQTVGGGAYSTMVVIPTVVNSSNVARLFATADGFTILNGDIDFNNINGAPYAIDHTALGSPILTGVVDGRGHTISNQHGITVKNANGTETIQGTPIFGEVNGGVVKNLTIVNARGNNGVLFGRVELATKVKNIVADITSQAGAAGGRVSLLGVVAETSKYVTVENVVVNMFTTESGYAGLLSTHAGAKTIISGVYGVGGNGALHSPTGNAAAYPVSFIGADRLPAVEGEDYFVGPNAEFLYDAYRAGEISDYLNDRVKQLGMYVEIDSENIDLLQNAKTGFYVLTEDIDMTGKVWKPTQTSTAPFIGNINGYGHKITNLDLSLKNDPEDVNEVPAQGFIAFGKGAIVKNLYLDIVKTGVRGGLFGQIYGGSAATTTVSNVAVYVDTLAPKGAGITGVVQGNLLVKDTIVNIKNATAANAAPSSYGEGVLSTMEVATNGVQIDNVMMISEDGKLTKAAPPRDTIAASGLFNTAGAHAAYFEDYTIERGILDYDREALPTDELKDFYDEILSKFEYTEVNQDNASVLKTAEDGYFYLTSDIDMTNAGKYKGSQTEAKPFTGTLNGNGHKIYNVNANARFTARDTSYALMPFVGDGATFRNIEIEVAKLPNNSNVLFSTVNGRTLIDNVVVTLTASDANNSNLIANNVNAELIVKDSLFTVLSGTKALKSALANQGEGSLVISNVFIADGTGSGALTQLATFNGFDGQAAEKLVDYEYVTDILDVIPADLSTEFVQDTYAAMVTALNPTVITNDNVDALLTAETGYFVLGENIDLTGKEWAPTATFTGTLNGKQYNIEGVNTALFNALGEGAVIRTVGIKASGIADGDAAIAKSITGNAKLENVGLYVASMPTTNSGAITANVAADKTLTLKEVFAVIEGANSANAGVLAAGEGEVAVDGLNVVTSLENLYAKDINGTANVYKSIDELMVASADNGLALNASLFNSINTLQVVKAVTQANVEAFLAAREGYWYLASDIDLTNVTIPTDTEFYGTFDGEGYAITGASATLFKKFGGTMRNVAIKTGAIAEGNAILAAEMADASVYDVTIDATDAATATLVGTASDKVAISDVFVKSALAVKPVATVNENVVAIAENVVVLSGVASDFTGLVAEDETTAAAKDVNYFEYTTIDQVMGNYAEGTFDFSDVVIDGIDQFGIANKLDQSNITELLGSNTGYWYLYEDVDLAGVEWTGGTLNGTLDGLGHTIKNFERASQVSFSGFLTAQTACDVTIKNLKLNIKALSANHNGLFGQIRNSNVLIENVVLDVDKLGGYNVGLITDHANDSNVTLRDVVINIDVATNNNYMGLFYGCATTIRVVNVFDHVSVICPNADIAATFGPADKEVTFVNKDGAELVNGTDYLLVGGAEQFADALVEGSWEISDFHTDALTELGVIIALNQENIALLDGARGGYWYLTEDVDMTGITFDVGHATNHPDYVFNGIFNGAGYTIDNFTPNQAVQYSGLFGRVENGAVIKNLRLNLSALGNGAGLIGLTYSGGDVYIENVVISVNGTTVNHVTTPVTHKTPIAAVIQANLHLKDVLVVYEESNPSVYSGLAVNAVSSSRPIYVDGVYVVAAGSKGGVAYVDYEEIFHTSGGQGGPNNTLRDGAETKTLAEKNVDFFIYASLDGINRDNLGTDFLKAEYDKLTAPAVGEGE